MSIEAPEMPNAVSAAPNEIATAFHPLDLINQDPLLQERLSHVRWAQLIFARFSERPEIAWKAAHVVRVASMVLRVAKEMGFDEEELEIAIASAITHDSGFIDGRIKAETINREGALTQQERIELDQHPLYSAGMVNENGRNVDPKRQKVARIIAHHHQRQKRHPEMLAELPELLPGDEKFVVLLAACDQMDTIASGGEPKDSLKGRPYMFNLGKVNKDDAYRDVVSNFPGQEEMVRRVADIRYMSLVA